MRTRKGFVLSVTGLIIAAVALAGGVVSLAGSPGQSEAFQATEDIAIARLINVDGDTVGSVWILSRSDDEVSIHISVGDIPPGFHAFHIHAIGECTPPDFTSAGGHFNPEGADHGEHAGDLPVLYANSDGTVIAAFEFDRFSVEDLFGEDGTAVIIHAEPDNYANIPERYGGPDEETLSHGDAGARIACGVVMPMESPE